MFGLQMLKQGSSSSGMSFVPYGGDFGFVDLDDSLVLSKFLRTDMKSLHGQKSGKLVVGQSIGERESK
jgi:hypothetical protein